MTVLLGDPLDRRLHRLETRPIRELSNRGVLECLV